MSGFIDQADIARTANRREVFVGMMGELRPTKKNF